MIGLRGTGPTQCEEISTENQSHQKRKKYMEKQRISHIIAECKEYV